MNENGNARLLEINDLAVTFYTQTSVVRAVRNASLHIDRGEVLGLVGESGCGKSTVAFALMGYLPGSALVEGSILFEGTDVASLQASEIRHLRGNRIAMVYQDPGTSLTPTMRVGPQIEEVLVEHMDMSQGQARTRTAELFESVGLADPTAIGRRFPHELSGGMQQRVVIAMALACDPHLLIMDEPTTGLDVTTEATILDLVVSLKDRVNAGILFVSHNLGVIARIADRVAVMYGGQTVEEAPVRELFKDTKHPYTTGLLSCVPQPPTEAGVSTRLQRIPGFVYRAEDEATESCLFQERCPIAQEKCSLQAPQMEFADSTHQVRCFYPDEVKPEIWGTPEPRVIAEADGAEEILDVDGLQKLYGGARRKYLFFGPEVQQPVRAVEGVNFKVGAGRTLGIVGESGSGKSTVARTIVGLTAANDGHIVLRDSELAGDVERRSNEERAAMRMVFQNPTASLNPKLPIKHTLTRALQRFAGVRRRDAQTRAGELLVSVGMDPEYLDRSPGQLSGGQQQRVALAGAFAANPDIVVADEAVSSLDVSVQAQVLNLLEERQKEAGNSYVFISHDLGVVRYVSDDILVLYAGNVAEYGSAAALLNPPFHPYTEALLSAAPVPDPDAEPSRIRLEGAVPTMRERFTGCFFAGRCPRKLGSICDEEPPPARQGPDSANHTIYCHIPVDELSKLQESGEPLAPSSVSA